MRRERAASVHELPMLGGKLCLDFANTVDPRGGSDETDYLVNVAAVIAWAERAGVLSGAEARRLRRAASDDPAAARRAFRQAIELREAAYRIFLGHARGGPRRLADLELLNARYAEGLGRASLIRANAGYTWARAEPASLDDFLWPVAASAIELLTSSDLGRVKECASDDDCGRLFFDATRSNTRRWCQMDGCGSRAKARRYYERRRSHAAERGA